MKSLAVLSRAGLSRRLTEDSGISVSPRSFLQTMDVDVRLDGSTVLPNPNIPGYQRIGLQAALARLSHLADLGLRGIVVRIIDDPVESLSAWRAKQAAWVDATSRLVMAASSLRLEVVVDPFSAALRGSGQWGIFPADGTDKDSDTAELIRYLTTAVQAGGAHGIVTLGRVPCEVEATRAVAGDTLDIYSFSTNSETSAAYAGNPTHAVTNQKIMPGNMTDMLIWSLLDVHFGTTVSVTKPIENFHAIVEGRQLLRDVEAAVRFLSSARCQAVLENKIYEREAVGRILSDVDGFAEKAAALRFGAYTVSGTSQLLALVARSMGVDVARARLRETWINALAAAGPIDMVIIDRGAADYFAGSILH